MTPKQKKRLEKLMDQISTLNDKLRYLRDELDPDADEKKRDKMSDECLLAQCEAFEIVSESSSKIVDAVDELHQLT